MYTAGQVEAFRAALGAAGSPTRAVGEKAYLKSDLAFYGTGLPTIRAMAKAFQRANPELGRDELLSLVNVLWQTDQHELRTLGIVLLELHVGCLVEDDLALVEDLVRRSRTWAYVDGLASKIAGSIVERFPETKSVLRRWAVDEDFWIRRASLLALLDPLRAGRGDWALFAELASPMLDEREFFIRKAIGWILREVAKKRPALTYGFLNEHIGRVSGLTLREGAKYLPAEQREELMGLYGHAERSDTK